MKMTDNQQLTFKNYRIVRQGKAAVVFADCLENGSEAYKVFDPALPSEKAMLEKSREHFASLRLQTAA